MKGKNTVGAHKDNFGNINFDGIVGINNNCQATTEALSGSTYWEEPTSAQFADILNTSSNGRVIRRIGSTPSSGTGPASAQDGISYIYVETSGASDFSRNKSRVFIKIIGEFDAGCRNGIDISYYYMQYGTPTDMIMQWQYLPEGADDTTGWIDVEQHYGNTEQVWIPASFNLRNDYGVNSGRIKLRWYWQMGDTGNYYQHDQAIDTLLINEQYFIRGEYISINTLRFLSTDTTLTSGSLSLNTPDDNSLDFVVYRTTTATYIDVNGIRQTADAHVPRTDYTYGSEELLVEPTITNLYEYSEGSTTQYCTIDDTIHTVSFEGSGSIDFSGAFSGSLSGSAAGPLNRVSLSFTGSATGSVTSSINGNVEYKQFEKRNYVTSFIPTNGSTVTRNFDKITAAGSSGSIDSTQGTLFIEFRALGYDPHNEGSSCAISINDGTSANFISLRHYHTSTASSLLYATNGTAVSSNNSTSFPDGVTDIVKMALSYEEDSVYWYVNGTEIAHDITFTPHAANTLNDLSLDQYWGDPFYGRLRDVRYYKDVLTPAQMTSLTGVNSVYVFDASTTDYFSTTYDLNGISNVSMVMYGSIGDNSQERCIFGSANSSTYFYFRAYTDDDIDVQLYDGTNFSQGSSAWASRDTNTHQFVFTFSTSVGVKIFIDGTQLGTTDANTDFPGWTNTQLLQVGRRSAIDGTVFDGTMRVAQIYNRTLSDAEVETLYVSGIDSIASGRVLDLNNTKTETTWTDDAAGTNDATNAGGVTLDYD